MEGSWGAGEEEESRCVRPGFAAASPLRANLDRMAILLILLRGGLVVPFGGTEGKAAEPFLVR